MASAGSLVHVKETLGCCLHCGAPRYRRGTMVNPGRIKEEQTAKNHSADVHLLVAVGTGMEDSFFTYTLALVAICSRNYACRNLFANRGICNPQLGLAGLKNPQIYWTDN